ncbi:MAG: methionyl-tRNA formyltransferase [Chloroflexi bacterium]|nr:methionyl-tRNA formyltransferase [Chloroflexota bacterium]
MLELAVVVGKLPVVFMGTPEFAVPPLEHLLVNGYRIAAVYTRPDRPAGRGRAPVASPVKRVAQNWNLPVRQPASLKNAEVVAGLADLHPEVIVVAAFGQLLPQAVLDIPRRGCINIHPSLLPRYRGASPVPAAILAGDEFTGVSIMLMDKGLDTGPVLARAAVAISPLDNTGSLTLKLALVAAHLLQEALSRWLRAEITPRPQDEAAASYSSEISKAAGEIDWRLPAVAVWRRVRAFNPWPGGYTRWRGKQLKIIEALPLPAAGVAGVGKVVALAEKEAAFGVHTGEGVLGVRTLQLEGKRAMPAAEFLKGQREFIGSVLPG